MPCLHRYTCTDPLTCPAPRPQNPDGYVLNFEHVGDCQNEQYRRKDYCLHRKNLAPDSRCTFDAQGLSNPGVDLNRNFPTCFGPESGGHPVTGNNRGSSKDSCDEVRATQHLWHRLAKPTRAAFAFDLHASGANLSPRRRTIVASTLFQSQKAQPWRRS